MMKKIIFAFLAALCFSISALAQDETGFIRGDVDQDGHVNITDVTTLIDYLLTGQWPAAQAEPEVFTVNGVSFTMIPVEGGTFTMGATEEQSEWALDVELPTHEVTLSSFSIGETEVTQELWLAVMGENPSYFTGDLNRPVENVSWNNCQTFISKLNEMTGKEFRLPTEAEWEYAARGGNRGHGYVFSGCNWDDLNDYAWNITLIPNPWPDPMVLGENGYWTYPVATKKPNELGIYDMSGNVWEWCSDKYGSYSGEAQTNPTGDESGIFRINRGGSFKYDGTYCRVSKRSWIYPSLKGDDSGLRLAL